MIEYKSQEIILKYLYLIENKGALESFALYHYNRTNLTEELILNTHQKMRKRKRIMKMNIL